MNVGLLTVRNEVDVIDEFLVDVEKYFTDIVVMDDSNDGTFQKLKGVSFIKYLVRHDSLYNPRSKRTDGKKQHLYEYIVSKYGMGTWVTILNADAFFGDNPNHAVARADKEGATQIHWTTYNFHPHDSDEIAYKKDEKAWLSLSIQKRLKMVNPHEYREALQFKVVPGLSYNVNRHHRIIPDGLDKNKVASFYPVLLHYPLRSPGQIIARRDDRIKTGFRKDSYYEPFIKNGGFVRPNMKLHQVMVPFDKTDIKLFTI